MPATAAASAGLRFGSLRRASITIFKRSNAAARGEESVGLPSPAVSARAMRSSACSANRAFTGSSIVLLRSASMVRNSAAKPTTGSFVDTTLVMEAVPMRARRASRGTLTKIDFDGLRNSTCMGRPVSCSSSVPGSTMTSRSPCLNSERPERRMQRIRSSISSRATSCRERVTSHGPQSQRDKTMLPSFSA